MVVQNYNFLQYQLPPSIGRSKKYDELSQWRLAQQEISQYDLTPIERKVRKIRLERMFQEIKNRLQNAKPKELPPKPDPFEQLKESRKLGNHFSETNKFTFFSDLYKFKLHRVHPDTQEMKKLKARKSYGNKKSEENREKIKKIRLTTSDPDFAEVIETKCPSKTHEYGDYYSNRFKVKTKLKREDYDLEFQQLIIECLEFEKTHKDVSSVIEEIINLKKPLKEEMNHIKMLMSNGGNEECFEEEEYKKLYGDAENKSRTITPLPQQIPDIFIDLKPSTLIQEQSEEDDTSDTASEVFSSLTKILGASESNTRSYKYSIENTSLVSIEKPVDSDITDESRTSSRLQPSCSQDTYIEEEISFDVSKKRDNSQDSSEGMLDELKSKILEGWSLNEDSSTNLPVIQDKLIHGIVPNILDGKYSEGKMKNILTAIQNRMIN